jgi:hypothetical protein|tara:strand:- start:170 stop:364 length:195 start_codon:yes stop_codon:yes gene_type:complete
MTKEVVILESVEQSIIYKALKDSKILSDLATKILHGKPIPEDHVVEILPEHKHPEVKKTSDKPF